MPKAHTNLPYRNLRPIEGTPYALAWDGEPSTCSHCLKYATHVVDKPIASPYSAMPDRTRTYRLCADHAESTRRKMEA